MTIKTICQLTFKKEEISDLYIDYEVYPLASIFADSDDEALASYITKIISPHIEIQECYVMEVILTCGVQLTCYRAKGKNATSNHDIVGDYLVIDTQFIGS